MSDDATPLATDNLSVALRYAETNHPGETPDQVVTRAKAYALFLGGNWMKVGVVQVAVVDGGVNYASVPNVVFEPAGAEAVATLTNGIVTSVAVKKAGAYDTAPTVTFEGGGGTGATAVATLAE
jgi:starch-binding outer membrane protein, SusD/RagB family